MGAMYSRGRSLGSRKHQGRESHVRVKRAYDLEKRLNLRVLPPLHLHHHAIRYGDAYLDRGRYYKHLVVGVEGDHLALVRHFVDRLNHRDHLAVHTRVGGAENRRRLLSSCGVDRLV